MVYRCNGIAQIICTGWCLVCLLLLAVGTILTHNAFKLLIPTINAMPVNLKEGLDSILSFDQLEGSAAQVKIFSKQALSKCQISAPGVDCEVDSSDNSSGAVVAGLDAHNVSVEVDGITAAFTNVLDVIEKVTTDKYLGIEEFGTTGEKLRSMKAELDKLKGQNESTPCIAIVEGFCPIWKDAGELMSSMDEVNNALSMITDNEAVKNLEENGNRLAVLHIIPYIGWIGMLFYTCFFVSDRVVTICKGGSCWACIAFTCHSIFFVLFFVITVSITGIAIAGSVVARDYAFEEPFLNKPTLAELVDHIEVKFPDFYDVVLKDFVRALESVRAAFLFNTFACLMLFLHTVFSCCCSVYDDKKAES